MNGTNMEFENIINNATAVNAPYGDNWVQNTDVRKSDFFVNYF